MNRTEKEFSLSHVFILKMYMTFGFHKSREYLDSMSEHGTRTRWAGSIKDALGTDIKCP